jgi:Protein of unknown function (DUF4245)
VTETPATLPEPVAPARRPRGRETVGDMVRSLAVVLGVVAVVVLLTLRDDPSPKVSVVGYAQQLQETRHQAAYDVLAPVGLGTGWKATSARGSTDGGATTWHLGFVTPDGHYAAIEQSDGPVQGFLDAHVDGARRAGSVTVSGVAWQRLDDGKPETRALVLRGDGVTTLVTGSASFTELRRLAAALQGG